MQGPSRVPREVHTGFKQPWPARVPAPAQGHPGTLPSQNQAAEFQRPLCTSHNCSPSSPQLGNEEQQLAWAKRESEKAERERVARLRRLEQEDLERAIALSKADMPA